MRRWRQAVGTAALVALVALLAFVASRSSNLLLRLELATLDARFHLRGTRPPDPRIVIVAIDEESLAAYGQFPLPRSAYAALVDRLSREEAQAIVFDVLFADPTQLAWDTEFSRVMAMSQRTFLAAHVAGDAGVGEDGLWRYTTLQAPLPLLAEAAAGVGAVTFAPDPDAVYRRANLLVRAGDQLIPHLMLEVARAVRGIPPYQVFVGPGGRVQCGPVTIPTNRATRLLVDYAGGKGVYPRYSFAQVVRGEVPAHTFKDKIVLVGANAAGLEDIRANPFAAVYPAVEINANLLENLLNDRYLQGVSSGWALALTVGLALLVAGPLGLAPLRPALLGGGLAQLLYLEVCMHLFSRYGLVCELVPPLSASLLAGVVVLSRRLLFAEREQRWLRQQFQLYVPAHVLEEILDDPQVLQLGGARREVTVLFADIRGFTQLTEQLAPEQVVDFLNDYFSVMTEVVFRFEGMVDKFVGDEIMAVFNVPLTQGDHALRAVKAALQMQERLRVLHRQWMQEGKPLLTVGIGIESGAVVVGNIGSNRRMDYSVIGDPVNVAARLEELSSELDADILVGETTFQRVRDAIRAEYAGEITLRGRLRPIRAYRVVGVAE